ncbi:putative Ig domain-containing protein [Winogradskya humida]|uniref:Hint domain-containing protein n=1 Tax=Winogradskya humida TaxID=113566 RepID=A0ABQ4A7U2_9ACTN|nr:putative Ig domain-containing protein [Actinoplanes humidus]GIE26863.1 hypothetical protein Ahu01nite_099650 [Actinoplanes humidus]
MYLFARNKVGMESHLRVRTVEPSTPGHSSRRARRITTTVMVCVTAVLATFLQAPAALAAAAPLVAVPAGQFSGVGVPLSGLGMTASGGTPPLAWSATSLPTGLTIDALTGVIKGTATTAGTYAVKVTAKDAANLSNTAAFSWTTGTAPVVATLAAPGYRTSTRSVAISGITHSATGASTPYGWSATGLPTGLTINSSTGAVTGTPAANGSYSVKVTATAASKIPSAPLSYTWDVADALAFTAPATQQGTVGQPTTLTLTASGGTNPFTWTVTGLPAGLTLDTATGVISGTPTTAATSTVSATAKDAVGRTLTRTFSWVVAVGPTVTAPATQNGTTGSATTNLTVTATGGTSPYSWSATGLPTGLAITTAGVISGTPTAAGSSTVTLTAKDATGRTGSKSFTWNVAGPLTFTAPTTQQGTVGQPTTLTLTASGGTNPYTWTVTGLPAGLTATTAGVISGTPTTAATATVSATAKDTVGRTLTRTFSWVVAVGPTVTAPATQNSTTGTAITNLTVTATGGTSPYTWTATGLPTGLAITTAGVISGTPTTASSSTVTLTAKDATGRTGSKSFTWNVAGPLTFTAPPTQQGTVGIASQLTLAATGGAGPYTWTVTGLPAGLTLDTATGVISGTPTTAATSTVSATAKDAVGRTLTGTFTWVVAVPVAATNPGAQTGTVGVASTLTLTATGGTSPYTWSATGLPSGLAITSGGVLSGTPTVAGTARVTATVTDSIGRTSSVAFTVTIKATVAVTNPGEQSSTIGVAAQLTLAATGGDGTYIWKAEGLPAGLTLDTVTGVVSGTPATAATGTVKITATDPSGAAGVLSVSWTVVVPASLSNPGTMQGTLGIEVSQQLTVTGGKAPYAWKADGLPAGLSLAAGTGLISGTPTRGTTATVMVTVTDALKNTSTVTFSFVVVAPSLTLTTPAPDAVDQGQPVAALPITVAESAGPLTWTADGLPDGLTIGSTTGVITGIARSAGTFTVSVAAVSDSGRAGSTSFPWKVYTAPATGPVMDSGTVAELGPDVYSNGVAILGGYAYTVVGYKVVRYDLAAGKDAVAQIVAGGDGYGCGDAGTGGQARFYGGARVIGTDGSLIYVADYNCALRAVTPATGATRTISAPIAPSSTISGHFLYTADSSGRIWRYNLQSGQSTRMFESLSMYGVLAADSNYLWGFNNSDNKLYRLTLDGTSEAKTFPLPSGGVSTARSTGDYVYYTDNRNLLSRISKTDGSLQVVAGDGASGGLLYYTSGIAGDGTYLYTAGEHGLARLTSTGRTFAPPAAGPVMDSATAAGLGPDVYSSGVAVLGGYAYTVVGYKVVRYDLAGGKNTPAQSVAGGDSYGCGDAGTGGQARFYGGARVIGTDGSLIYVADYNCALRAVTPATGATRTISAPIAPSSTIAGHFLYTADSSGRIWRYNLQSGQTVRVFEGVVDMYGVLAADDTYLWGFNNSDNKLYRLSLDGSTPAKTFPLPSGGVSTARSAGEYLYYTDNRNLLSRISKTGGSLQVVAGDGAHDDDLLYFTSGIAGDGTYLYTAGEHGLARLTSTGRTFAPPAAGPVMDSATVAGLGPDAYSNGVAILGGYAYTVVGYRVVRYDLAGGRNAPAQSVAGGDSYGCGDAGNGAQARFYGGARVIGTDGSLIYVADYNCALRAVNPITGATRAVPAPIAAGSTIAGHYLYTADSYGRIWRYNLQSGQTTRMFDGIDMYGVLAADNTYLWAFNNSDNKLYRLALDGSTSTKTFPLPSGGVSTARSAGEYLYYADNRNLLSRISKTDGSLQVVAGDGAHDDDLLYYTSSIASDGTYLYTAGEHGLARLATAPRVFEEPADRAAVDFGDVRPVGTDVSSGGVAVLGGYAYTVVGYRVVRYDLAGGKNAPAQSVAGGDSYGCSDAGNGAQARFYGGARVIGTDGSLIYIADYNCALRAVNPITGATRAVPAPIAPSSTIAGHYLYTADSYGRIWRYNLQTGQTTRMFDGTDMYGVLAADNTYLWAFNNSDNKLYRLALDGTTTATTFSLPSGGVSTARSAGNYLYYTDNRNLLSRISKTDGSLQIVAGDGAHGGLLHTTNGIATDGAYLYTAGDHGLSKLAPVVRTFAPPATGPILDSGVVTRTGPDRWSLGMTVINGYAYTGVGTKVVRVGVVAGADPAPTTIAGGDSYGCDKADVGQGAQARFYNANIIGNDGELIYVNDPNCGLRTVNPQDGTTTTIGPAVGGRTAVAGQFLYSTDSAGKISRYDLGSGVTTRVFDDVTVNGPLAADGNYLWGFDNAGTLRGLALNGNAAENKKFSMPSNMVFAALSVGDYIYFVDGQNLLSRISKGTGSLQIVAGDGAHNDALLSTTMGIAADGSDLYTAGEHGLYKISTASRGFTDPIADGEGPSLGIDSPEKKIVSLPGSLSGVAVVGWYAFTASGSTVSKTNIYTGETRTVAGGNNGCGDASTGAQATFYSASVVGFDGSLIYVFDSSCGLRAVNPVTGSTRTLRAQANQRSSIAGEYLYTINSSNTLYQYGLKSGVTNKVMQNLPAGALMAASESGVFIVDGTTKTTVLVEETGGKQVEGWIGVVSKTTANLQYRVMGSYMAYADHALYVMADVSQQQGPQPPLRLTRIDVIGAMNVIGESSGVSDGTNAGFAVTNTDIYRLNNMPSGTTNLVRTHTGGVPDENPTFQVDLTLYVEDGTPFIPVTHAEDKDYFGGHALFWDPKTGLCVAQCQGIKTLAQEYFDRPGSKEGPWLCSAVFDDCTVEDYEEYLVHHFVDEAGYYEHSGDLSLDGKKSIFAEKCAEYAIRSSFCEVDSETLDGVVKKAETIYDVLDLIRDFLRSRGGGIEGCVPHNSFRGDTRVLMANGETTAIQDIRPGQQVLASDPTIQKTASEPVTAVHVNTDTELTDLTLTDGSVIHTTAHHLFWTPGTREWTDAEDLVTGTILSGTDGGTIIVESLRNFAGSMAMYNLTVDNLHTYYVLGGTQPVLVHNTDCPQISLGASHSDMAQVAMDYRMRNRVDTGQNVAVFRTGEGADVTYHVAQNVPGGSHSEQLLSDYLKKNNISPDSVTGIYSERIPCSGRKACSRVVAGYRNAEQQFSLNSDQFGLDVKLDNKNKIGAAMSEYKGPSSAMPDVTTIKPVS